MRAPSREVAREQVQRVADWAIGACVRVRVEQQHAQAVDRRHARRSSAGGSRWLRRLGASDHPYREIEIGGAARASGPITARSIPTVDSERHVAARRNEAVARLVAEHAAEGGRDADRAADVGAELERHHAGRDRRGAAARRAAGTCARRRAD